MTSSSYPCSIDMCERPALALCDCHNKYLCNDHFIDHTTQHNETNSGLDLPNNTSPGGRTCFTNLNKWCRDVYQRMTRPRNRNHEQSEDTVNNQQIEHDPTEINESKRDDNISQDLQSETNQRNLFPLKDQYQTIDITDKNTTSMTCNEKHLLIEQKPNLCLFDRELVLVKQIPWAYDRVDMCWSSTLSQFILVTDKTIFTLDENTMIPQRCQIFRQNQRDWSCGACSDTTLYLSAHDLSAFLYEYTLKPSIEFVKEWNLFVVCPTYEFILTFNYGNERLALVISNTDTFQMRLDLRLSTTLELLWSVTLNMLGRCCSINHDQWIVVISLESQVLHISSDGKILQDYKDKPKSMDPIANALQWGEDTIVTITKKDLNLHKL